MAVVYVTEERDAQGRVVALPPFDVLMGYASDIKPTVDSAGRALRSESTFWERDTDRRYVWDGREWLDAAPEEVRLLRETNRLMNSLLSDVLLWQKAMVAALAWNTEGQEFTVTETLNEARGL